MLRCLELFCSRTARLGCCSQTCSVKRTGSTATAHTPLERALHPSIIHDKVYHRPLWAPRSTKSFKEASTSWCFWSHERFCHVFSRGVDALRRYRSELLPRAAWWSKLCSLLTLEPDARSPSHGWGIGKILKPNQFPCKMMKINGFAWKAIFIVAAAGVHCFFTGGCAP